MRISSVLLVAFTLISSLGALSFADEHCDVDVTVESRVASRTTTPQDYDVDAGRRDSSEGSRSAGEQNARNSNDSYNGSGDSGSGGNSTDF